MKPEQTRQLGRLIRAWEKKSDMTVTPEQQVLVQATLKLLNVDRLDDPRVPGHIGPLLCSTEQNSQEFPRWWREASRAIGRETALPKAAQTVEPVQHLSWRHFFWLAGPALLLFVVIVFFVTLWDPIKQNLCESSFGEAWLNCPTSEPLPIQPRIDTEENPAIECPAPCIDPIRVPVNLPARQPDLAFLKSELQDATDVVKDRRLWQVLIPPLLAGLLVAGLSTLLRKQLEQTTTRRQTEKQIVDRISLSRSSRLFIDAGYRQLLSQLRYHEAGPAKLHVRDSVQASSKSGIPQLSFKVRQRRREFVLVIPEVRTGDWRGCYFRTLATELVEQGVTMHVYSYQHFPNRVYPETGTPRSENLLSLTSQFPQATLVIGVNEVSVFHRVFGSQLTWLDALQHWRSHLLWFDTPCHPRRAQILRDQGFRVVEFTEFDGPDLLIEQLAFKPGPDADAHSMLSIDNATPITAVGETSYYQLPEPLRHLGDPAVIHNVPERTDVRMLGQWLRGVLGHQAFALLCATAVYPKPDWRLTRLLADDLDRQNERILQEPVSIDAGYKDRYREGSLRTLRRLAQLPWLQHGYFPLWLRRALVDELDKAREAQVANVYRQILDRAETTDVITAYDLTIDVPVGGWRAWLEQWRGTGALKDVLFASVVGKRDTFKLSHRINKLIRAAHLRLGVLWPQAMMTLAAMVLTSVASLFFVYLAAPVITKQSDSFQQPASIRLAQNNRVEVTIQFPDSARDAATLVEYQLKRMNYRVLLQAQQVQGNSESIVQQQEPNVPNVSGFGDQGVAVPGHTLSAPAAHDKLLKRIIEYALYDAPVVTKSDSPAPQEATLTLGAALLSGQVFRDPVPTGDRVDVPIDENGKLIVASVADALVAEEDAAESAESKAEKPAMVKIEAGNFLMGSDSALDTDADSDEFPQHRVTLSTFELGKLEVTWREWSQCEVDPAGGCEVLERSEFPGISPDELMKHPVVNVSFTQANQYIDWLNGQLGESYRLPTEAEWEYAARAGTVTRYSWGEEVGEGKANCEDCLSAGSTGTLPVGSFADNPWKLHDMHGNVWEWVADCWHGNYSGAPVDGSAWDNACEDDDSTRVLRGGSWFNASQIVRAAIRGRYSVGVGYLNVGFRLARTLP